MKIVNKGALRILFPENGHELVNINSGIHSDKVYLGKLDTIDNYIEVMKDGFIESIADLKDKCDEDILLIMETIDSLLFLLEPVLVSMPYTLNSEEFNPFEKIINFYAKMIQKGYKYIDDVPASFKEGVLHALND